MSGKLIIGLGTGRCGTHSLAKLLQAQPGGYAVHELRPILPWVPCRRFDPVDRLRKIRKACSPRGKEISGDVALFYLNYLPLLIEACPELRVIALKRLKEATVESYIRKLKSDGHQPHNHFSSVPNGHLWYNSYPKYDLPLAESLRKFYDEYYELLERHVRRFPRHIRLWPMSALNAGEGVREILAFAGVRRPRIKIGIHVDAMLRGKAKKKVHA